MGGYRRQPDRRNPESGLSGTRLAAGNQVAPGWSDPSQFNRKPTGIVAVDGNRDGKDELYLAVQDLRRGKNAFDEAPAATVVRSTDYGRTWQWDPAPMFTVVVDKTSHYGRPHYLNDGRTDLSEDSWDGTEKVVDWWGYEWPRTYHLNRVVYTTGKVFPDGGWFANDDGGLRVQIRRQHKWIDVDGLAIAPPYPYDDGAGPGQSFTLNFDDTWGDGVRIIGSSGGAASFTSIAELEVFYV